MPVREGKLIRNLKPGGTWAAPHPECDITGKRGCSDRMFLYRLLERLEDPDYTMIHTEGVIGVYRFKGDEPVEFSPLAQIVAHAYNLVSAPKVKPGMYPPRIIGDYVTVQGEYRGRIGKKFHTDPVSGMVRYAVWLDSESADRRGDAFIVADESEVTDEPS